MYKNYIKNNIKKILGLPIWARRSIVIMLDLLIIILSITYSYFIFGDLFYKANIEFQFVKIIIFALSIGLPLYIFTGQYKGLARYLDSRSIYQIILRNTIFLCLLSLPLLTLGSLNYKFIFLLWIFLNSLTCFLRFILRDILLVLISNKKIKSINVAIYGAGSAGVLLAKTLSLQGEYKVRYFLDDSSNLWKSNINGIPIIDPNQISEYISDVDKILLSMPSVDKKRLKEIINFLQSYGKEVLQVPSINDITTGRTSIASLRPIDIKDLLGRNSVLPLNDLLYNSLSDSVVCVTGAGGSIGSQLCREICEIGPKKLILFERSEASLYNISSELENVSSTKIFPILGCAQDKKIIHKIIKKHKIDIFFHAAAHKHVPIVEENPIEGIANNVISTLNICDEAYMNQVKKVVLISTDKAVRPTNVMGSSKRLAELIVQMYAEKIKNSEIPEKHITLFSIVRFGNVLGSSGSVVPLFIKQIANGGPITLTHKDIVRYFMTIKEASQLVIQASSISNGGELFLLDMGEPMKIYDLAEKMIRLSGLTKKSSSYPNGDIEIVITGLRAGEKLYEELLIEGESKKTIHPLIYIAKEKFINERILLPKLDNLLKSISLYDKNRTLNCLKDIVVEWERYVD